MERFPQYQAHGIQPESEQDCDDREFTEVTSLRELTTVSSQSYS